MPRKRRAKMNYSQEFKQEAVRLSEQDGIVITKLAKELGVSVSALTRWRTESRQHGQQAFPGQGHQTLENAELTRLRRENARLRQVRDILKMPSPSSARTDPSF